MIVDARERAAVINGLVGRPYEAGAMGPERFDCYGLARHLQRVFFGRALPLFQLPAEAGRYAIASAIAVHPERAQWREIERPVDGAIAVMSRQGCGFHMGTYLGLDGGIVVHTLEQAGVLVETPFMLASPASRWRVTWHEPEAQS